MKAKQVKIYAPATIANVGPGFDVLGVAIDKPGDVVVAKRSVKPGLDFTLHSSSRAVPSGQDNVAAHVAQLILTEFNPPFGISMMLYKKMPIGSGLGSSGASCAAAAAAVNALLPKPLPKRDLLRFAVEGERLASGSPHADNVAASLLGGICLIPHYHPLEVVELPVKNIFYWVVIHPHLIVKTQMARDLLPETVSLSAATEELGNLGGLITGLITGNAALAGKSIKDTLAEPVRAALIPGFFAVKNAALDAGALGCSISGSGPSVFAVATSLPFAKKCARAMKDAFLREARVKCDIYISRINKQGAKLMGGST